MFNIVTGSIQLWVMIAIAFQLSFGGRRRSLQLFIIHNWSFAHLLGKWTKNLYLASLAHIISYHFHWLRGSFAWFAYPPCSTRFCSKSLYYWSLWIHLRTGRPIYHLTQKNLMDYSGQLNNYFLVCFIYLSFIVGFSFHPFRLWKTKLDYHYYVHLVQDTSFLYDYNQRVPIFRNQGILQKHRGSGSKPWIMNLLQVVLNYF